MLRLKHRCQHQLSSVKQASGQTSMPGNGLALTSVFQLGVVVEYDNLQICRVQHLCTLHLVIVQVIQRVHHDELVVCSVFEGQTVAAVFADLRQT